MREIPDKPNVGRSIKITCTHSIGTTLTTKWFRKSPQKDCLSNSTEACTVYWEHMTQEGDEWVLVLFEREPFLSFSTRESKACQRSINGCVFGCNRLDITSSQIFEDNILQVTSFDPLPLLFRLASFLQVTSFDPLPLLFRLASFQSHCFNCSTTFAPSTNVQIAHSQLLTIPGYLFLFAKGPVPLPCPYVSALVVRLSHTESNEIRHWYTSSVHSRPTGQRSTVTRAQG